MNAPEAELSCLLFFPPFAAPFQEMGGTAENWKSRWVPDSLLAEVVRVYTGVASEELKPSRARSKILAWMPWPILNPRLFSLK